MSVIESQMVNEDYDPSDKEESVLDVLGDGRATPKLIKERTSMNDQQVNYAVNRLMAAGWVDKISTGLYELVEDPRDE